MAPGDVERTAFTRSGELGVSLDEPTVDALRALATDVGMPWLEAG